MTKATVKQLKRHFASQRWVLIDRGGFTGRRLNHWLNTQSWHIEPAMELDSFDVIVNLVSLGLGVSLVPHRELAVVVRRNRVTPEPLRSFVGSILF